jgi:hypothetical protein
VTLSEVKDALFQDYLQESDNRWSISHYHFVYIVLAHCHSLTGVQLSSSGIYSFLRKEGAHCALLTLALPAKQQQASGVALILLHWSPPLTLSKGPGVAMESHR